MKSVARPGTVSKSQRIAPKRAFDVDDMILRVRRAVKAYPPAAMFQLHDEGFTSVFEILVACIISIRTLEQVTLPTARKLFAVARTPKQVAKLTPAQIDELIGVCTFHEPKAKQIFQIAVTAVERFGGKLPCDFDVLTSLRGVGPKCANLVLGIACNAPHGVPVDIHVHRVTNRWGYVDANSPERTMIQLEKRLPRKYWMEINKLLVPFGKYVCTMRLPKCSTCPVLEYCRQIGVDSHR